MSDIPIIGQPGGLRLSYPTTLWECYCKPQPYMLLVLIGVGVPVVCPSCGKQWVVTGMSAEGLPQLAYALPQKGTVQ